MNSLAGRVMGQTQTYRVPRRYITAPPEPAPYGLMALSLVGHLLVAAAAGAVSVYLSSQLDQSKVYIVNLVPAAPTLAPPARGPLVGDAASRPAPPAPRAEERTPPRPPRAEPARETPPPRPETPPARVETPPPRPVPATPTPRAAEPPPRPPDLAPRAPGARPPELALPRPAQKETPALDVPGARDRLADPRAVVPPPPPIAAAPRLPDPSPRVVEPAAPPAAPALPAATVAGSRPSDPGRPAGRPEGTAGAAPGNISLDVNDFPFTYYLRQIHAKINERWVPPRAGVTRAERAVVLFEITRDGQVRGDPQLERPSGNEPYDLAALRAIKDAVPFPPLPPEFKGSFLRVHFGFELRTDQG